MKKIFYLAVAVLLISTPAAMAQQDSNNTAKKPKKEGGFVKFLKKSVESTTGLNVSKETLFVYPTIGEWKMSLVSAIADPETGNVVVKINVSKLSNTQSGGSFSLKGIVGAGGIVLRPDKDWEYGSNGYDFLPGNPTVVTFRRITVPKTMKSLDAIKFTISNTEGFEARDVPIEWKSTNEIVK